MAASKWIFRVFMVLLAMIAAWILYSLLLEYPYSTVLSLGANVGWSNQDVSDYAGNNLNGKRKTDYVGNLTKSALWQTTDSLQVPFGSFYYYYTMLPSMRADELVNGELCNAIGISTNQYAYKIRLVDDMSNLQDVSAQGLASNMLGYIPMNLSFDDNDDVLMNYPVDSTTKGKFYTTGWY